MTGNSWQPRDADVRHAVRDLPAGRGRGSVRPPVQPEGPAGEPAAHRGRRERHRRPRPGAGPLGSEGQSPTRDPVHPGPGDHAGLHRRAGVVDLAAMREAMQGSAVTRQDQPAVPAELVIDHSVIADLFGRPDAFERNVELEFERNQERFQFLRWGQQAFDEFKVVPPGTGIVHQVNIEHLARVVLTRDRRRASPTRTPGRHRLAHPMQNGLGVLGWGVGGIEAEAAMLGQPISMLIPKVVGFRLTGELTGGTPPPTWCSPSPSCCASTAWSASSWSSSARAWPRSRWPTGPRSGT